MQGAHEETRSYGPLIVLAGALVMAIAPFTAIAFGDSLFVQTHRDLMWSLDAPIYTIKGARVGLFTSLAADGRLATREVA